MFYFLEIDKSYLWKIGYYNLGKKGVFFMLKSYIVKLLNSIYKGVEESVNIIIKLVDYRIELVIGLSKF